MCAAENTWKGLASSTHVTRLEAGEIVRNSHPNSDLQELQAREDMAHVVSRNPVVVSGSQPAGGGLSQCPAMSHRAILHEYFSTDDRWLELRFRALPAAEGRPIHCCRSDQQGCKAGHHAAQPQALPPCSTVVPLPPAADQPLVLTGRL